jgi:hypothetical protein
LAFQFDDVQVGCASGFGRSEHADLTRSGPHRGQDLLRSETRLDVDGHIGMATGEPDQNRRQRFHPWRWHGDQIDPPATQSLQLTHRGLGLGDIAQHNPCRPNERLTRFAEYHAAPDTMKQRHAQFPLEPGDRLRQRRLGNHQLVGGPAETAVIDDGQEELQLPRLQFAPL